MKNAIKIRLISIAALLIIAFATAPSSVKADFWDDVGDFLNPVKRVENLIEGRPLDNFIPPLPGASEIVDPFCLLSSCDDEDDRQAVAQHQNPPTVSFWASPTVVSYNGSSVLTWNSTNSQLCRTSGGTAGWAGMKSPSGTFHTGGLTSTTTFHIRCGNTVGSASGSVTVVVSNPQASVCQDSTATNYGGALPCVYPTQICQNPTATNYGGPLPCTFHQQLAPTVNIYTNPSNIGYNGSTTVSWNSNNATSCFGSGGTIGWSGNKNTSGSFFIGSLTGSTTFHILCSNSAGSTSRSATVHVGNNNNTNSVSVNITADDTRLDYGDSTRIRWNSNNASYCTASGGTNGWSGYQNTSGSFNTGSMTSDRTFRITCYNNHDSSNDSVNVRVDDDRHYEPEITTRNATNIGTTSATLNGRVDGSGSSTKAWFEYGTSTHFGYTTTKSSYGSNSTNFSKSVSNLMPNTTYYFRAVAENGYNRVYGNIVTLRTTGGYTNPGNNQPTVIVYADHASISYNGATTIKWSTANASSCFASGGTTGWAGAKSVGSGSFYTGVMTSSKTFTLTCSNAFGYGSNSVTINVKQKTSATPAPTKPSVSPSSMVLIASSVERNQVGAPSLDNSLRAGDEINYLVSYQNVGTASISGLTLRIDLDRQTYFISSNPENSNKLGNIVIFNLGTLKANEQGTVAVRALIQPNIAADTNLNFTATLSYIDPSKAPKSVTTNASAQIVGPAIFPGVIDEEIDQGANAIGAGFLPTDIFGWFILFILVLVLLLLSRHLYGQFAAKKTVYIEDHHHA